MNKVATYLNEHLSGEVVVDGQSIAAYATDGSQLLVQPEMVAHVASTSDIRKIMRFCWQLAEKGHTLSVTARGSGENTTGASIGGGIIVSLSRYMNHVVGIDPKQRLIHIQSGAMQSGAKMVLSTHSGMTLPSTSYTECDGTVGGGIASGAAGYLVSRYGRFGDSAKQLEVVLANGDVLQTNRLTKRDVNAKKGLHTFEGEIYRQIDNLITDNKTLIDSLEVTTSGYSGIAKVKKKDGSMDLTPLFIGSEGTLGIVSEVILQAQFARKNVHIVVSAYETLSDAHVAADSAANLKATAIELIDGRILKRAATQGKKKEFAPEASYSGGLLIVVFDDFSERNRQRLAKKLEKELAKTPGHIKTTSLSTADALATDIHALLALANHSQTATGLVPGAFSGLWLPSAQVSAYIDELKKAEKELSVELPVFIDVTSGRVDILPVFDLKKVTDRQKMLRALSVVADLIHKHSGALAGYGGEGRLKSLVTYGTLHEAEANLYQQIKTIFDPHGILNPGVKQKVAAKDIALQLNAWCRDAA